MEGSMDKAAIVELMEFPESRGEVSLEPVEGASSSWNETDDGGSAYCRDMIQCLKIFPLELWAAIFGQVEDPNDLQSISNASLFFRKVLFDNRVVFLFPAALRLMEDTLLYSIKRHFKAQKGPQDAMTAASVQKCISCGRIRKKKWFSEFLSLRLVCSVWCSGLDQVVQERQFVLELPERRFEDYEYAVTTFYTRRDIRKFIKHFRATHEDVKGVGAVRSPFLGGCVELDFGNDYPKAKYILKLLSIYGHHIRKFDIADQPIERNRAQSYSDIRQFLGKLPRLKGFAHAVVDDVEEDVELKIMEELAIAPLPKIEDLQFLRSNSYATLTNVLLHSSSNLSTLYVEENSEMNSYLFLDNPSLKLKELEIFCHFLEDFELLEIVDLPLKKLKMCGGFDETIDDHSSMWATVIRMLGNKAWTETLTEVKLFVSGSWLDEKTRTVVWNRQLRESLGYRLELPRMKHLDLSIQHLWSLDFLLPAKDSLETLHVGVHLYFMELPEIDIGLKEVVEREQVIQFLGYFDRMYESNIWILFPKLKEIKLKHNRRTYSRRTWEWREAEMLRENLEGRDDRK